MSQIKTRARIKTLAEVFTAEREVKAMLDMVNKGASLSSLDADFISLDETKFLEPSCGNGNFLIEILERKLNNIDASLMNLELDQKVTKIITSIYGVDIAQDNVKEARSRLLERIELFYLQRMSKILNDLELNNFRSHIDRHIQQGDFLKQKVEDIFPHIDRSSISYFDIIIGNPPYQTNDILSATGEHSMSASPLYHLFIEKGIELNPKFLILITPTRWVFGGKGLDDFRSKMLADRNIMFLVDFWNAKECFPDVDIKGGVSYFLWARDWEQANLPATVITMSKGFELNRTQRRLDEYDIFIRSNEAVEILRKVLTHSYFTESFKSFQEQVMSRNPYGIPTNISTLTDEPASSTDLLVYGNQFKGYMPETTLIKNRELIAKYKVIVAKAGDVTGTKTKFRVVSRPKISEPETVNTETYLVCGIYDTLIEAEACKEYLETKFFRFMLWLRTQTQNVSKDKFKFVPQLENKKWTDEQLYDLFDLTTQERSFIEKTINLF